MHFRRILLVYINLVLLPQHVQCINTTIQLKKNVLTLEVDVGLLSIPDMIKQLLNKALQKKTYLRFADASQMLQAVIYCEQKLKQARARATQQDDTE